MPKQVEPLTAAVIQHAVRKAQGGQQGGRDFPLVDGKGLYLEHRSGRFHWRFRYVRPDGRENRLALGQFPEVSLAEARDRVLDLRRQLRDGVDPGAARKAMKEEAERAGSATFAHFAQAWIELKSPGWAESTRRKAELCVDSYLVPALGKRDVRDIASHDVVEVLQKMSKHAPVLTRKAAGAAKAIIRLAIAKRAREEGRLLDLNLRDNLPSYSKGHYSAATNGADIATVLRAINALPYEVTRAALLVCAYTAQRPGDVAAMRWVDVDTDTAEWLIPKTKTGQSHIVPLSRQVLTLVESMKQYTAGREYVFPPLARQNTPHLHRDTLSKALRDAGLQGKQTPHGLRATLRTLARERLGVSADVLEAQLAHAKKGEVQAAYDRTGFVEERTRVMQVWADYLDGAVADNVTPPKKVRE